MFGWFETLGLDRFIYSLRNFTMTLKPNLPSWTYYSLPDGLWVYSFTSALLILWKGKANLWLLVPLFTGTFAEIAQGIKILPGTFDMLDLTFTSFAFLISYMIINSKLKQIEKTVF